MKHVRKYVQALVIIVGLATALSACNPRLVAPAYRGSSSAAAASSPRWASCTGPSSPPNATVADAFDATNRDRAAHNLPSVQWDGRLYCLAIGWSQHMASASTFSHQDLASALPSSGFQTLGENILHGPGSLSGGDMEISWMNSPAHQANILSTSFSSIGIAEAFAADGTVYVTADFGG